MRLTLVLLGHTFDVSLEPTAAEVEDDGPRDLGYVTSTPVGFVACHEIPGDIPGVDRNNGWGDEDRG